MLLALLQVAGFCLCLLMTLCCEQDLNAVSGESAVKSTEVCPRQHSLASPPQVRRSDVQSAWSGIRPLAVDPRAKDTASALRDHIVLVGDDGLVTVTGVLLCTASSATSSRNKTANSDISIRMPQDYIIASHANSPVVHHQRPIIPAHLVSVSS